METLFDHNPTQEELSRLFGDSPPTREFHASLELGADTENGFLFRLYSLRGEEQKAQDFLGRIQDPQYRFDVALKDVH